MLAYYSSRGNIPTRRIQSELFLSEFPSARSDLSDAFFVPQLKLKQFTHFAVEMNRLITTNQESANMGMTGALLNLVA